MSASLFALFDDIAILAKAAAASIDDVAVGASKASVKAAGVVIDDAAVSPQYVQGITPDRELPVVWRITRGSLINKAIIVAGIMLLSVWAPWVFAWLLLIGGTYLAYEGAEKVLHWLSSRNGHHTVKDVLERTPADEKQIVKSAVRTDMVLSVEIMLISLASIEAPAWQMRLAILILVAILMTVAVYGTVALLVKMDDVGFWLRRRRPRWVKIAGTWLVKAMPYVFKALTVIGAAAMLWVGGHILIVNLAEVGVPVFANVLHDITHVLDLGKIFTWIVDSLLSAVFGLAWGLVVVGVVNVLSRVRGKTASAH